MFHARVSPDKSRSSHQRCSVKKCVLRNFAKFTRKHLFQSLSFNKVADLNPKASLFCEISKNKFLTEPPLGGCFCKSLNRLVLICFIFTFFFFITMHEIDTAVEVPLEPFQTFMVEIYSFCLLTGI